MAHKGSGNKSHFRRMGHSRNRLVRVSDSTCCTKVCHPRLIRLERLISRRFLPVLALRASPSISASMPNTQSSTSSQLGIRVLRDCNTQVEETILAAGSERPILETPHENSRPEIESNRRSDGPRQQSATGSLVHFGWDSPTENWSTQEKALLFSLLESLYNKDIYSYLEKLDDLV
ncbi:unnamed protein product [Euphydryas editha]|uniref:Uncharacterized protein n=1 Tax=Euphydryas editha TaxID=104508 RepID=A0AAU9UQP2_EUPED|nr:unnamed protein product [Euphydryas editha]